MLLMPMKVVLPNPYFCSILLSASFRDADKVWSKSMDWVEHAVSQETHYSLLSQ